MRVEVKCPNCNGMLSIEKRWLGQSVEVDCPYCSKSFVFSDNTSESTNGSSIQQQNNVINNGERTMHYSKYTVLVIEESGLSTLLVGSAKLPIKKIEQTLNQYARSGWQVVFQVVEKRRFLLFWSREAMIVTLGHV